MSNRAINWVNSLEKAKGHKAVLFVMADNANKYMATWTSRETIAKRTGYREETIRDYQNAMVKDGTLIAVPWQTESGADASPGYFLGCAVELFDEMPALEIAFERRINFHGVGRGGRPRGYTPEWWSGRRLGAGHRCTSCGGACHGSEKPAEASDASQQGYPDADSIDPPQGRSDTTLEGRQDATLPGGSGSDPFNPNVSKPEVVSPKPRASAEALARSVLGGYGTAAGGLRVGPAFADAPAGHGSAAPDNAGAHPEAANNEPAPDTTPPQHLVDDLAALPDDAYMDLRRHVRDTLRPATSAEEITAMHARAVELGLIRPAA